MRNPEVDRARKAYRRRMRYAKPRELHMMTLAVERWLQEHEPELQGVGGELVEVGTHGPRVRVSIAGEPYLFDLRRKHIGYRVVVVWREESPLVRVWPEWDED